MGKLPAMKRNKVSEKPGTKVKRQSSIKKNICRGHRKRLCMLRRRISVLLDEKETWKAKNRDLVDNFNTEKKLNAELQKDVLNWQRLYHEAIISQNTYKVKNAEIIQNVSTCLKEIKTVFPHLVGLSDTICRNQIRLTNLLNTSHALETETHLPRAFGDGRQGSNRESEKSEKRMKHKVGPMVKGVLIQKPTIRLERVMLQQPQDQEPTNNDLTPERGNTLTPIVEENEQETDVHLEQISMRRRRKHRLGTGERWRMRKQQDQIEKERQMEREKQRHSVSESSDSEDQLGPVIRLQRISGLLLSPNLLEVDRGRSSEGKAGMSRSNEPDSHRQRPGEDPKEGCSWMHLTAVNTKKKSSETRKRDSSASSDSSDKENDSFIVAAEKKARNSFTDSLYKNKTFTMERKTSSSSSTADTSRDASDASKVEPDSTNNIDDIVFAGTSASDSLGTNVSIGPLDGETRHSHSQGKRGSGGNSRSRLATTPAGTNATVRSSQDQRRSSSFCNNCIPTPSPDVLGKRVRKPKIHTYPGEEDTIPTSATKKKGKTEMHSKGSNVSSRLSGGTKTSGKRSQKNSLESGSPANVTDPQSFQGRPCSSSLKKKTVGRPKKSSVKKASVEISRNSGAQRLSQDQVSDDSDRRNSRRNRAPISYKEPNIQVKTIHKHPNRLKMYRLK